MKRVVVRRIVVEGKLGTTSIGMFLPVKDIQKDTILSNILFPLTNDETSEEVV